MLNRLYIVIGVLAILLLTAAFVAPAFIPWNATRPQLEAMASKVVGAPVTIAGDIGFTLLPQPRLTFSAVKAGPPDAPALSIGAVEAEFSLVDFLRDRFTITRLALDGPVVTLRVADDGVVSSGLSLDTGSDASKVAIASATVTNGDVQIVDALSGNSYDASGLTGELKADALNGPFSFQGTGKFADKTYGVRVTTGTLGGDGSTALSVSLRPDDEQFNLTAEGQLQAGAKPKFTGSLIYRQPPPKTADADAGRGDMVFTSKVEAGPARVLLTDYLVIPDENRATTRLQGDGELTLGKQMAFNSVMSGGVLALPPRDATQEKPVEPYELLRLLRELPALPVPPLDGVLGIGIAELDLRGVTLRNVRMDARVRDGGWVIDKFTGDLPGSSSLAVSGTLSSVDGHSEFAGQASITTNRLDVLSSIWRKPAAGNPLFNLPGAIDAKVDLVGETLSLSEGRLTIDGETRPFDAELGLGDAGALHLSSDLGVMDAAHSAALLALLPDAGADPQFVASFPSGQFTLTADTMNFGDLIGRTLSAKGSWDGGVLVVDDFSAADLGGVRVSAKATAFGTLDQPELSGEASLGVDAANAPLLAAFYKLTGTPTPVAAVLGKSMPLDLALQLDAPSGEGTQSLAISGTAGASRIDADIGLEAGLLKALDGNLAVKFDLKSADPTAVTAQLGLGDVSVLGAEGQVHLVGQLDGNLDSSLAATVRVDAGKQSLGFSGNLVVTDPAAITGNGTVKARLDDPGVLLDHFGAGGIALPPIEASARLEFEGTRSISLSDISGTSNGEPFSGDLSYAGVTAVPVVSGDIATPVLDVPGLWSALAGPAGLLAMGDGVWPDGPLDLGQAPRTTSGRVRVTSPLLRAGDSDALTDVHFDLAWDPSTLRLRDFSGTAGTGTITGEVSLCCAGTQAQKSLTGRIAATAVPFASILPEAAASGLGGSIDLVAQFEGSGDSADALARSLSGQGSYTVSGLSIARLDPNAVTATTGSNVTVDTTAEVLNAGVEAGLDAAPFTAATAGGSFTIAGGVLRSPNVSIAGTTGQLFGSGTLRLGDLGIGGSYALTPTALPTGASIDLASAKLSLLPGGTLLAPSRQIDASGLVSALLVKASEAEIARLEQLKAEDDARQKAAAEEQARLDEQQRQADEAAAKAAADKKAADDAAAKKAADDAAKKKAAADAAKKKAADDAAADAASQPMNLGLGN